MTSSNPLIGCVKLQDKISNMPKGGLTIPRHRVELYEEVKPDSAWMAELNVLGELPWCEGEERRVEIRIMSDEFCDHVTTNRPYLIVRYGNQILGSLELE